MGHCLDCESKVLFAGMFNLNEDQQEYREALDDLINKFVWVFFACTSMGVLVLLELIILK